MPNRPRWTDDQLREAVAASRTVSDVCRALGIRPCGGNYETVWKWISRLGIDGEHLRFEKRLNDPYFFLLPYVLHPRRLAEAAAASRSVAGVCRHLGIDPVRHRDRTARELKQLGIDVTHFAGQAWRKGSVEPPVPAAPLSEVLGVGQPVKTSHLRRRLLSEGLKEHRCEGCGLEEWLGRPIPLELDHVNGDRADNRLVNLRLICPNCHAQTPTYRGRNIGRRGVIRQARPA